MVFRYAAAESEEGIVCFFVRFPQPRINTFGPTSHHRRIKRLGYLMREIRNFDGCGPT